MRRLLTLLFVTTALAGCGSGDNAGDAPEVDDDAGTMVRALGLLPEDDDTQLVIVNDYAAAGEALELDRPDAGEGADEDAVADWFIPLTVGREETVGGLANNGFFENPLDDGAWRDELGWAPIDVDVAVELQTDDGPGLYGFIGDFDLDAIDEAVTDDDNPWADELDQDGNTYVWGDDPAEVDPERITTVRTLGRGGSMAVLDEHTILWAWDPDLLDAGVAAATGDEDSLADDDELGALAEAADGLGAMGASFGLDVDQFEGGDDPKLEPYEAVATGVRIEDGDPQVLLALLHEDDDSAEANVDALEEVIDDGRSAATQTPWSEYFRVDEIEADGDITTAVLDVDEPGHASIWLNVIFTRDSLLAT
jgi:hypothetical protein